jgi:hypothetical protein
MAFLDNSGDIILDAVLTDTGRFRMARGDFRISKFALGDDEVDYSLYNKSHPSGSAYYDLEVLRTPVLEAFTNNTSLMKSKLLSITATNVLHMPVLKLLDGANTAGGGYPGANSTLWRNTALSPTTKGYIVTCDTDTETVGTGLISDYIARKGIILGSTQAQVADSANYIAIERGLDTTEISPKVRMPATLQETQFIIEADYRLGALVDIGSNATSVPVSFIDDDQIASYYVSEGTTNSDTPLVRPQLDDHRSDKFVESVKSLHNIRGPRDRVLQFKIMPSINLTSSDFLFDKLGSEKTITEGAISGFKAGTYKFIDSIVRVTSATTAYSIDIPVRYIKHIS